MNAETWKAWSLDKSRISDGYVFAIPQERNRYIVTLVRDRPQWLKKNVGRWRRIEDVQQEAAPLVLPAESEVDLGAEPAEPNGQTSFRGVRDNGDASPQDAASAVTLVAATVTNWTTKAEVLSCARAAIEAGEDRRNVTELLAIAQNDFHATQREIAAAVGRSASWVNHLLNWRRSGYKEHSPFGPTTRAGRIAHAQQRTKASKPL